MVEISSATAILSPLRASVAAFWAAVGAEVPSSLAEGLSSFAEVPSSFVKVPSTIAEVNCTVADVICKAGDEIAMIAGGLERWSWWTGVMRNLVPLKLSLTAGYKKTISAVAEATALIINWLTSGVGENYSLVGWKWS